MYRFVNRKFIKIQWWLFFVFIAPKQNLTGTSVFVISTSNLEHNLIRNMTLIFRAILELLNGLLSQSAVFLPSLKETSLRLC